MMNWLQRWAKTCLGKSVRRGHVQPLLGRLPRRPQPSYHPEVVMLEERLAPAIRVWDGGGANNLWTTAANWVGDVAPQQDDNLLFPAGAARLVNQNDFTGGTRFRSVTIANEGYQIAEQTPGANGI